MPIMSRSSGSHGGGVYSAVKKLLRRRPKKGHIFVYIGEKLKRFEVSIEDFNGRVGELVLDSLDPADKLDIRCPNPFEIRSCSVERFRRLLSEIEEERNPEPTYGIQY